MRMTGTTTASHIECPTHGPMTVLQIDGIPIRVRCEACGMTPLHLLERATIGATGVERSDAHRSGMDVPFGDYLTGETQ